MIFQRIASEATTKQFFQKREGVYKKSGFKQLSFDDVQKIRRLHSEGKTCRALSEQFGIGVEYTRKICNFKVRVEA